MSAERQQLEGAPKGKLRVLSREEKQNLIDIMLGKGQSQNGITSKKSDNPTEDHSAENPSGDNIPNVAPLFHEAFEKYGEPTMTLEELREEMAKELGGKSLSDLVIEDRKASDKSISAPRASENLTSQDEQGLELLPPNSLIHQALKKYGKPTMSREELAKMLDKELDGESLSDFLIQDRRKKPY